MNKSMTATLKYALTSDKKMAVIAKLVSGKKVNEALDILKFTPKKGARTLYKVVASAQANAINNADKKAEDLYIEKIDVSKWPKIKRVRFTSRSRISHYVKYRSFVRVVLNTK